MIPLPHRDTTRARRGLVAATAALGLSLAALVSPALAAPAGAQPVPEQPAAGEADDGSHAASVTTMSFKGRGWGHGRGLSQWGSQGYATVHGWSSAQILDHYYGGTHAGAIASAATRPVEPTFVRIRLIAQDARPTVVGISDGTLKLVTPGAVNDPGNLTAVRLSKTEDGTLLVESSQTCAGPWTPVGDGRSGVTTITVSRGSGTSQLQLCRDDGVTIWYPGSLRSTVVDGVQRSVNITAVEDQLRSVVPRESPASWDADALQSQAVAARSYALAGDSRHRAASGELYADTCDTTLCQVYVGHFRKDPGQSRTATTDPRTDAAIQATSGIVRLDGANRVARTEFSSTSGGWTAGGTFPAVEDKGDAISPLHTWQRTVAVAGLETSYGQGGRLTEIEVLARNGLGADGGRVTKARLHFSNGVAADVSGNVVRSSGGLLSDWFTPVCGAEVRYVNAVYELFVDRLPTSTEVEARCAEVRRGDRFDLTSDLSVSDEWAGVQINDLYEKILGRPADASGRAFWLSQVERGLRIEDIAAEFYGSTEYFRAAGSTHRGYVDALYLDLLGRPADSRGRTHWTSVLDAQARTRSGVASEFYASIESRIDRVEGLYHQILGRGADGTGRTFWTDRLRTLGDVALAAHLAASDEYYATSVG